MTIKPVDIFYILDDEDLAMIEYQELHNICVALSIDFQIQKEENERQGISSRGSMC